MSHIIGDNITSPLGNSTESTYQRVRSGYSGLKSYERLGDMPIPITASLFTKEQKDELMYEGLTWFESLAYRSSMDAINVARLVDSKFMRDTERTLFILSTTKGNIAELALENADVCLGSSAKRIATLLGISTMPLVVCNACISGLSALITANRLLEQQCYDYAIICGVDVQSEFIFSGFRSLNALSPTPCKPFDAERVGLNIGEAAATIVLSASLASTTLWEISSGIIRNDAFHNSTPINSGEGLTLALNRIVSEMSEFPSFVNAHGTATLFNDQMEAMALKRANIDSVPVNALKGYFGHTLGAAGVLETIISIQSLEEGLVLGTRGFEELGVSVNLKLTPEHQEVQGNSFVKMLSGFGGCNAVVLCSRGEKTSDLNTCRKPVLKRVHGVHITPRCVDVDGSILKTDSSGGRLLTEIYKSHINNYPKYYKMDSLSRLGFVAAELLLQAEASAMQPHVEDRAVIFFNRCSSIETDRKYQRTISDKEEYFPSPSLFVYTLPNIATSEIAIKNEYHGETCLYVLPERNEELMEEVVGATFCDKSIRSAIAGWIEYEDEDHYEADICIIEKQ